MRNQPKPISENERRHQTAMRDRLQLAKKPVTVIYEKRDGTMSQSTGTVEFFNGRIGFDTGSVTIADPSKGSRTINLHRIASIIE